MLSINTIFLIQKGKPIRVFIIELDWKTK